MNLLQWHWRDVYCYLKLRFSKRGYVVKDLCGDCDLCNGIFAMCGSIPCPMRMSNRLA